MPEIREYSDSSKSENKDKWLDYSDRKEILGVVWSKVKGKGWLEDPELQVYEMYMSKTALSGPIPREGKVYFLYLRSLLLHTPARFLDKGFQRPHRTLDHK